MTCPFALDAEAALPALVIGGWLGAGKTTLVNHLLRQAGGRRIAVLVNDFGDVSIDADLIVGAYRDVLALAGGCVCCSTGGDLVGALHKVLRFEPRPEQVLIECSGVGLPAAVARTARLVPAITLDAIVVLADAATLRERAADAYVGDTLQQQLDAADLLVLNRCDEVDDAARRAAMAWLAQRLPRTPLVCTERAALDPALLLGWHGGDAPESPVPRFRPRPLRGAAQLFSSETRTVDGPTDVHALAAELAAPGSGVLRAKGIVRGLDGRCWLLQTVGRRTECAPWSGGTPAPTIGRLLVIRAERRD